MAKETEAQEELFDTIDPMIVERQEELAKLNESEEAEVEVSAEEVGEEELAAAAQEAKGEVEYDDTTHEDDTEPADELPAGDATDSGEGGQEAASPDFDPVLLTAVGLDAEQAKAQFGTPTALKNAVRLLDTKAVNIAQSLQQQQAQQQQQQQQPAAPEQTSDPAESATEFKMPETSDGEEWDEDVKKLVESMTNSFNAKFAEQQRIIDQQRQATEAFLNERTVADRKRYVEDFDGFVNGLDESWDKVLGKGDGFSMDPNSPEIKARIHLDSVAQQLMVGRQMQQLPELPREELLQRALTVAFPEVQQQAVRKEVEKEVGKRHRMLTQRPGGRKAPKRGGEKSAATFAESWYRSKGMSSGPVDDFEYDEV